MKRKPTLLQRRQRQLSWLLYITEGYLANIQKATRLNEWSQNAKTVRRLIATSEAGIIAAEQMRHDMKEMT